MSDSTGSQRAADRQREMKAILEDLHLGAAGSARTPARLHQDVEHLGEGMLYDLDQLEKEAKASKK